ncbi:hypothetical protein GCM10023197_28680 [Gordonia humi]
MPDSLALVRPKTIDSETPVGCVSTVGASTLGSVDRMVRASDPASRRTSRTPPELHRRRRLHNARIPVPEIDDPTRDNACAESQRIVTEWHVRHDEKSAECDTSSHSHETAL